MISNYYNIPRVHVKELSDEAFRMEKIEDDEPSELVAKIKEQLDAIRNEAKEKIDAENAEKDWGDEEPPEVDAATLPIRVPDEIIYELLKNRLNENDCRNRGYVLEGFPRSHENCQHIFLVKEKKFDPETGEEIEEDEPELEEGQKKSFDGYIKN
jgi:adenylate kinase